MDPPPLTDKDDFKRAVRRYVESTDWVTFADLHKRFARDSREETQIELPGRRVVWSGLPRAMIDAVLELLDEGLLAAVPGHKSAYVKDGRVLKLPVERTVPPEGHEEPHWYPVLLRPIEAVRRERADAGD
ncbi:MAG: hypothetical protein J4G09_10150 [Proteobacteria bacterium]|nr:hypothetical protein [Pseudomonadota bacterium]